ncbi:citrate (Si)-synthase [Flavobacteriaceae bacterium UJ101]|nr:citrate (Si)-synthase [Flavobacteriaceae bacterium UJ101]
MQDKIEFDYDGKSVALPLLRGTMNETAIDISKLRAQTGLITLDLGFKNTGSTASKVTFLNGGEGKLSYRGYSIEELADKATFTEVSYLLINGELPNKTQLKEFTDQIEKHILVDEEMKNIIDGFPKSAHPMGILASLTCALTAFNPDAVKSDQDLNRGIAKLLAKFPVLASWAHRKRAGLPVNYSKKGLDYTDNLLQLLFATPSEEYKIDPVISRALNKILILHADHEQNCSASTVRIVGSSHAGLFASISAGVSALWGPLHGGANQAVIEMLEMIKNDGGDLQKWVDKAKDKDDDFRLMGFGHRVYKNFDPRARIIKKSCDEVLDLLGIDDPILDIAKRLEEVALNDEYFKSRNLYPNVDFYSGIIYRALGIPTEMFTVMFALGRLPGWIAQWKEMRENSEPIGRPRQLYIGETPRSFVEIDQR